MQQRAEEAPIDDGGDSDTPSHSGSLGSMVDEEEELLYAFLASAGPSDIELPKSLSEALAGPHGA